MKDFKITQPTSTDSFATAGNRSMLPGRFYQEAFSVWKFRSGIKKAWARTTKVFKNFCRKQPYLNSEEKRDVCNQFVIGKTSNL